jgi:acyl carrier protein
VDTPFYVQETCGEWQRPRLEVTGPNGRRRQQEIPRRAAINSFGAGGSNAHLIIEEYVSEPQVAAVRPTREATPHIMVFSAKHQERLRAVVQRMRDFLLTTDPSPALADLAYTLQLGREAMPARLALVARERVELLQGLTAFLEKPASPETVSIPMFTGNMEEDEGIGHLLASAAVRQALLKEHHLEQLALYWARGGEIPWEALHEGEHPRLILLPTYPFARERYWLAASRAEPDFEPVFAPPPQPETPCGTAYARARAFLLRFLSRELHLTPDQLHAHRDLRHYGVDSITSMRLIRAVEQELHVHMAGRDLLEHQTLHALATCLGARIDAPEAAEAGDVSQESVRDPTPDALDRFKQGSLTLEEMEALLAQGEMV